jgi:hypothetical protein
MTRLTDTELNAYHGGRAAYVSSLTASRDRLVFRVQADAYADEPSGTLSGILHPLTAQQQRANDLQDIDKLNAAIINNI